LEIAFTSNADPNPALKEKVDKNRPFTSFIYKLTPLNPVCTTSATPYEGAG
jgi:hypothetical protein